MKKSSVYYSATVKHLNNKHFVISLRLRMIIFLKEDFWVFFLLRLIAQADLLRGTDSICTVQSICLHCFLSAV